jgi:Spy/CpxP family protein refolding chaperone
MKKILVIALMLALVASLALAQEPEKRRDNSRQDRYRELLTYRVTKILVALELDADSEKGLALMKLVKNNSQKLHPIMSSLYETKKQMMELIDKNAAEEKIVAALIKVEELEKQIVDGRHSYQEALLQLLTPIERAKMHKAESDFRQRLRRSSGQSKSSGQRTNNRDRQPHLPL